MKCTGVCLMTDNKPARLVKYMSSQSISESYNFLVSLSSTDLPFAVAFFCVYRYSLNSLTSGYYSTLLLPSFLSPRRRRGFSFQVLLEPLFALYHCYVLYIVI